MDQDVPMRSRVDGADGMDELKQLDERGALLGEPLLPLKEEDERMGQVVEHPSGGLFEGHVEPVLQNVRGIFSVGLDVVSGLVLDHQPPPKLGRRAIPIAIHRHAGL